MKGEPIGPRVREGLEIGAFVVLVQLFLGRFSGHRRRIATTWYSQRFSLL
jgi:hypothetical protein